MENEMGNGMESELERARAEWELGAARRRAVDEQWKIAEAALEMIVEIEEDRGDPGSVVHMDLGAEMEAEIARQVSKLAGAMRVVYGIEMRGVERVEALEEGQLWAFLFDVAGGVLEVRRTDWPGLAQLREQEGAGGYQQLVIGAIDGRMSVAEVVEELWTGLADVLADLSGVYKEEAGRGGAWIDMAWGQYDEAGDRVRGLRW